MECYFPAPPSWGVGSQHGGPYRMSLPRRALWGEGGWSLQLIQLRVGGLGSRAETDQTHVMGMIHGVVPQGVVGNSRTTLSQVKGLWNGQA